MKPKIESRYPVPPIGVKGSMMYELRKALIRMKPGQSFVWQDANFPYRAAGQVGIKVISRKLPQGGWRFWKLGEKKDFKAVVPRRLDFNPNTVIVAAKGNKAQGARGPVGISRFG